MFVLQLLSAWRAAGHTVGVDTYVRAVELWNKLPADTPPEELKTWLAPLVVSDKEEQIAFYALFDRLLPGWLARERAARRRRRWVLGLLATIIIMALGWGICTTYQNNRDRVGVPTEQTQIPQTPPNGTVQPEEGTKPKPTTPGPDLPPPVARDTLPIKPFAHQPDIDTLRVKNIPLFSAEYAYWDIWKIGGWLLLLAVLVAAAWWLNRRRYRRLLREMEAQRNLDTRATELKRGPNDRPPFTWQFRWAGRTDCYAEEDLAGITPRLRGRSAGEAWLLDAPKTVQATVRDAGRINFRYRQPTQPDEYLLLIDIRSENDHRARLFDAIFQHLRRNEVHIVRYFYRQDPRFCWSEHPQSAIALQDLHQRFPTHRLVMVGTGNALLGKTDGELAPWAAVFDGWRYRTLLSTRPPAQWGYEEQTLATRFRLAPATLRGLADWVDNAGVEENTDLNRWRKTTDEWAEPIALPDGLAPATFVTALRAEYTDYTPDGPDARLFHWIAATALSPVLHWDATRFFAEAVEQHDPRPNQPLFTPRALQQLCRLPWFTTGRMPDNARRGLLRWLQTEHPDLLAHLRAAWKQTLEQNLEYLRQQAQEQGQTPFEETTAYEQLRLTMLLNELALDDLRLQMPPGQRLQLENELDNLIKYTEPDIVALELLENAEAREVPAVGTDQEEIPSPPSPPWWAPWTWLWMPLLLGTALIFGYNGKGKEDCSGAEIRYRNTLLCLDTPQDSLLYFEYLLCDTLDEANTYWGRFYKTRNTGILLNDPSFSFDELVQLMFGDSAQWKRDSSANGITSRLLAQADTLIHLRRLDSTSFYLNTALALWNAGAAHYNRNQTDSACIFFRNLLRWPLRDSALSAAELAFAANLCSEGNDSCWQVTDVVTEVGFRNRILNRAELREIGRNPRGTLARQTLIRVLKPGEQVNRLSETIDFWQVRVGDVMGYVAKTVYNQPTLRPCVATLDRNNITPGISAFDTTKMTIPFMVLIKGGAFRMGSANGTANAQDDEQPAHDVRLSDYYIGRTEVTNAQFVAFLNEKGNQVKGGETWVNLNGSLGNEKCRIVSSDGKTFSVEKGYENHPTIYVSWYGARAYCQWLSEKTGQTYRLPTEAEWEYAARGGIDWKDGFVYAGSNKLDEVGWYNGNSNGQTHPVAQKKPSQRGLYDMSGNVWEWCEDDWHENYSNAPDDGKAWIERDGRGSYRVNRGGSWDNSTQFCRAANRFGDDPQGRNYDVGFRLVRPAL